MLACGGLDLRGRGRPETALSELGCVDDRSPAALVQRRKVAEADRFELIGGHPGTQCQAPVHLSAARTGIDLAYSHHHPFAQPGVEAPTQVDGGKRAGPAQNRSHIAQRFAG